MIMITLFEIQTKLVSCTPINNQTNLSVFVNITFGLSHIES